MSRFKHLVGQYLLAPRLSGPSTLDSPRGRRSVRRSQFDPSQAPAWFQSVANSRRSSAALREHLARQAGEERLEFLLVYMGFTQVANALQRFEHLRTLIHRFVRAGAERCIPLTDETRRLVMNEWSPWVKLGRVPDRSAFPCLEAAADEIHQQLAAQGAYGKGITQWLASCSTQSRFCAEDGEESEADSFASETIPLLV